MINDLGIRLAFVGNTFTGEEFFNMIVRDRFLGFIPTRIRSSHLGFNNTKFSKWKLEKIKKAPSDIQISIESKEFVGPKFSIATQAGTQVLNWLFPSRNYHLLDLDSLFNHDNLINGFVFDLNYATWESEESVNNYEFFKKEHSHLPKKVDPVFNEEVIDISKNPGRLQFCSSIWIGVTWKMLFGKKYFKYVPKDKLSNFEHSYSVTDLRNGGLMIRLFKSWEESDNPVNRKLQADFRQAMGLNELIE